MRISDWSSDVCSSDLYATQQFLKLILEHDGLGVGRVLLGRQLPSPPPDSKVLIAGPAPARPPGAPRARAIVAVIDDGIAFAHELFSRADGGTRVEFAWLQDGEDRKRVGEGKRVTVRVGLGGGRSIKKTKYEK